MGTANHPGIAATLALGISLASISFVAAAPADIAPGNFASVLPLEPEGEDITVMALRLDRQPVTNAQFLEYVQRHAGWQRGNVKFLFADENYLQHWQSPLGVDDAMLRQPVVNVSWFAARAYCESRDGRLPTWHEWEYVAAADETRHDARSDPEWRQDILAWYSQTGGRALPDVGRNPANVHGVQDLHGLVWEWVEDFNALLVSNDNREQGGADKLLFCGAGAATMEEKDNYAILMRTAMLSSLDGSDTTRNLGFRCAYDPAGGNR